MLFLFYFLYVWDFFVLFLYVQLFPKCTLFLMLHTPISVDYLECIVAKHHRV